MSDYDPTRHALMRVAMAAENLMDGYAPGKDVSLFRALRELHRVLGHDESQDPDRLIRALLFHGLSEHMSWTEVGK